MNKKQHFTYRHRLSSLLMLLMLAWLTVCLPYVAESQQQAKSQTEIAGTETPDSDGSNPLTNTNEEKSENGTSLLSEYLHHLFHLEHTARYRAAAYKSLTSDLYHAYHPDLIIPPPEA